jgi:FHA domain
MPVCPSGHNSTAADFCDVCGMRIQGAPPAPASSASGSGTSGSGTGAAGAGAAGAGAAGGSGLRESGEPCPQCGTERTGQFCEGCGYDYRTGTPSSSAGPPSPGYPADPSYPYGPAGPAGQGAVVPAASPTPRTGPQAAPPSAGAGPGWSAVVTADRSYFDRVIAAGGPDAAAIQFPAYCPERRFALSGREMRVGRRSVSRGLEPEIDLTGPPADPGISHLHAVLVAQPGGGWSVLDPGSSNGTEVNGKDIKVGVAVPLQPGDRVCIGAWTVLTIEA